MQKVYRTIASVLFNTNMAVSSSEENWSSIRENSYVRFGNDTNFYSVSQPKSLFYIKDFKVDGFNKISVLDNVGITLSQNDCLQISYKEYELVTIVRPEDGGEGYKVNEIITLNGGVLSIDPSSGLATPAKFKVIQVDEKGKILQVALESRGKYIVPPPVTTSVVGQGSGATFVCEYRPTDNRALVERTIVEINQGTGVSVLTLDSALPNGVTEGKLSIEKWVLYLQSNYTGESKINQPCEISRDFTPHLGLPLSLQGSMNPESVYNLTVNILDKRMSEMAAQIKELQEALKKR